MKSHRSLWTEAGARRRAIARVPPFGEWPAPVLQRLAQVAEPKRYEAGAMLYRKGATTDHVAIVVEGIAESSMSSSDGRRIVFKVDAAGLAYGLVSLIDGGALTHDMVFLEPAVVIEIAFTAIRAELSADPALWEPLARLVNARGRYYLEQMRGFLMDALPVRAAGLLVGLTEKGRPDATGPVTIDLRLTQERFAEMLGVTRQALTPLLRSLASDGLLSWRYGRVTLLDRPRLEALAKSSVEVRPQPGRPIRSSAR